MPTPIPIFAVLSQTAGHTDRDVEAGVEADFEVNVEANVEEVI